ncbi:sigma-70 family RNA polymerase sigma factor [Azoarcus indigens]|uniref:RNA polymerase RpoE-like sigma-24 subunit n=1 Tax=Azoarcus indigens TaxID=29545 RepID=A0A4R6DPR4_9RHOO|nr:sigma-70 family RNA polymerase sigma factor [Azoarcus indigens]NMG65972.1 sigma-70 family RNA polymerase sigma factor [Azoarcus indigens]TDN46863.1 RNA polymerase RpoE-like sigma-24 subunit [Azoarcus indigens]
MSPTSPTQPSAPPLAELYRDHNGWLLGWLRRQVGCGHAAADIAHDTFVCVLEKPRAMDGVKEPRAWLVTIARRLVFANWRRQDLERAWVAELAALPEAVAPSEEERAIVVETLFAIDRLLDGLSDKARRAFLLSQLDGLTYAEIAAELGVSVSRVRQYMTQALTRCYAAL